MGLVEEVELFLCLIRQNATQPCGLVAVPNDALLGCFHTRHSATGYAVAGDCQAPRSFVNVSEKTLSGLATATVAQWLGHFLATRPLE